MRLIELLTVSSVFSHEWIKNQLMYSDNVLHMKDLFSTRKNWFYSSIYCNSKYDYEIWHVLLPIKGYRLCVKNICSMELCIFHTELHIQIILYIKDLSHFVENLKNQGQKYSLDCPFNYKKFSTARI